MSKLGKKLIAAAREGIAIAQGEVDDVRSYTSDRVFSGTRELSQKHVDRLKARLDFIGTDPSAKTSADQANDVDKLR